MAKKSFLGKETRNLSDIISGMTNVNDEVKSAILGIEDNATKENVDIVIKKIEEDKYITINQKEELLNVLRDNYIDVFDIYNCPEDYDTLKLEAKFLAGITQYSFLLMAQRLIKIRDKQLYKLEKDDLGAEKYADFKTFIENELNVSRSTVYNYIDIVNFFGVQPVGHDTTFEYTKLLPIIPLLRSDDQNLPKDEIKQHYLSDIKLKSKKELIEEAKELKIKYGLVKERTLSSDFKKKIEKFKRSIPQSLDINEITLIKELANYLNNL